MTDSAQLRITEIFYSLQGESSLAGWPTVFVRLTGCPLRCGYCDTAYAFTGGENKSLEQILDEVASHRTRHVCVTGGEPLAQRNCQELLRRLCDAGYVVSLETSGALDISDVDPRVIRIVDVKTPASGESGKNLYSNLDCLQQQDEVKFVICNRDDYVWARDLVNHYQLPQRCTVLFSPVFGLQASELAGWILEDHLAVRFQIQLHKYLWGDKRGV